MDLHIEKMGTNTYLSCVLSESENLDHIALQMLSNNSKIPGLLPVSVIRKDNEKIIRYDISGKVCLKEYTRDTFMSKNMVMELLSSMLNTEESVKSYMLETEKLVDKMEYAYVDTKSREVFFVYVPYVGGPKCNYAYFVKQIVWSLWVDNRRPSDDIFYKKLKEKFQTTEDSIIQMKSVLQEIEEAETELRKREAEEKKEESKPIPKSGNGGDISDDPGGEANDDIEGKEKKKSFIKKLLKGEKKEPAPKSEKKNNLILDFDIPGMEKKEKQKIEKQKKKHREDIRPAEENNTMPQNDIPAVREEDIVYTVMGSETQAYLLRKKNGQKKEIIGDTYKIGRSENADFGIFDNEGVSRKHAIIQKQQDGYYIVDQDSRGGTWVNGIKIQTEMPYHLSDGDEIRLYNENLVFLIQ